MGSFSLMILLVAGIFLTEVDSHPQQGLQLRYKRIPFYSTHLEMQRGRFRPREAKQNDFSKESNDDFRVEQVEEQSIQDSEPEDLIADESAITESKVVLQPIYVPNRIPDLVPNEGEENVQAKEDQNDDILIDTTVGLDVIENHESNDKIQTQKLNRQQFLPSSFIQSTVSGLSLETDSGIEGVKIGQYIDSLSNQDENHLNQEDVIAKQLVSDIFEENPTDENHHAKQN